jgi:hypothetical protein
MLLRLVSNAHASLKSPSGYLTVEQGRERSVFRGRAVSWFPGKFTKHPAGFGSIWRGSVAHAVYERSSTMTFLEGPPPG